MLEQIEDVKNNNKKKYFLSPPGGLVNSIDLWWHVVYQFHTYEAYDITYTNVCYGRYSRAWGNPADVPPIVLFGIIDVLQDNSLRYIHPLSIGSQQVYKDK